MALPYLLLEAIGEGSTALGGTCSQRMSALGHKATCAPQKIMSALPRKRTFAVNSPCLLCAKSRHTSLRLSFLLSHRSTLGNPEQSFATFVSLT